MAQAGVQPGPQPVLVSVGGVVPPAPSPPPAAPDEEAIEAAEEEGRARAEAAAEFGLDGTSAGVEGARSRSMHDLLEQRVATQPLAELEMAAETAPAACCKLCHLLGGPPVATHTPAWGPLHLFRSHVNLLHRSGYGVLSVPMLPMRLVPKSI